MKNLGRKVICIMMCLMVFASVTAVSKSVPAGAATVNVTKTSNGLTANVSGVSSETDARNAVLKKYGAGGDFTTIKYDHYYYYYNNCYRTGSTQFVVTYTKGSHETPWDVL